MKCKQAGRILVAGNGTGNAELTGHLADCPKCRQLEEIVAGLEQLAGQDRQLDLSATSIRETQLQAASLLARNREQAVRTMSPVLSFHSFFRRPLVAALAAASVLLAVGVFGWRQMQHRRAPGTQALSPAEITAMNSEIKLLAGHIDSDLRGFRDKYRKNEAIGSVEAISAALRADIVSRAMDVRNELR